MTQTRKAGVDRAPLPKPRKSRKFLAEKSLLLCRACVSLQVMTSDPHASCTDCTLVAVVHREQIAGLYRRMGGRA